MKDNPKYDPLERFIAEHRAAFDAYEPDPLVWDRVRQTLDADARDVAPRVLPGPGKRRKGGALGRIISFSPISYQIAAAVLLLVGFAAVLRNPTMPELGRLTSIASAPVAPSSSSVAAYDPQLAKTDAQLMEIIQAKQTEVAEATRNLPELREAFTRDLERLDSMYLALKQEMATSPNRDQIASALVINLQMRVDVLNRQIEVLKKIAHDRKAKEVQNEKPVLL